MSDTEQAETLTLASRGRGYARCNLARDTGGWWYGLDFQYSYGGFGFPIHYGPFATRQQAEREATEHMLRQMHKPFASEPDSVKAELADLRQQVEKRLTQPSLF